MEIMYERVAVLTFTRTIVAVFGLGCRNVTRECRTFDTTTDGLRLCWRGWRMSLQPRAMEATGLLDAV